MALVIVVIFDVRAQVVIANFNQIFFYNFVAKFQPKVAKLAKIDIHAKMPWFTIGILVNFKFSITR